MNMNKNRMKIASSLVGESSDSKDGQVVESKQHEDQEMGVMGEILKKVTSIEGMLAQLMQGEQQEQQTEATSAPVNQ